MKIAQDRISIAKVKYFKAGSQETNCFVCDVLLDGVKFATADNEGRGGMTFIHPVYAQAVPSVIELGRQKMAEAKAFATSLPDVVTTFKKGDGSFLTIKVTLDYLVDDLVDEYLLEGDIKSKFLRSIKKEVLFVRGGKIFSAKINTPAGQDVCRVAALVQQKYGADTQILNLMDQNRALALYRQTVMPS